MALQRLVGIYSDLFCVASGRMSLKKKLKNSSVGRSAQLKGLRASYGEVPQSASVVSTGVQFNLIIFPKFAVSRP